MKLLLGFRSPASSQIAQRCKLSRRPIWATWRTLMAISRRYFFYGTFLAGAAQKIGLADPKPASLKAAGYKSPNEKLNVASIGAGGQAASNIRAASPTENIVALGDVDDRRAAETFKNFPNATKYRDFRSMLDKESKNIDACIV